MSPRELFKTTLGAIYVICVDRGEKHLAQLQARVNCICLSCGQPHKPKRCQQGIVYLNRNGNFCEGIWILKIIASAKVDTRVVLLKKSTGFCRMSVTESLLRLGALLQDNLQMCAFF